MTSPTIRSILFKALFTALLLCAASLFAQTLSVISFDAPDAGTGQSQGTSATCINRSGVVGGTYFDSKKIGHGFVRAVNGVITEFDAPALFDTEAVVAINSRGEVVGVGPSNQGTISYLRTASGHFIYISAPGSTSTVAYGLNDADQVIGLYTDQAGLLHGFIREANGSYTTIDDPDARLDTNVGTRAFAINSNGVVTGNYDDKNDLVQRAFVRDQSGNFTSFDPIPGGSPAVKTTSINSSGSIVGTYGPAPIQSHGFVRGAAGNVTTFDVQNALSTTPVSINDAGQIVGTWTNHRAAQFGFVRDAAGHITRFSVPGASGIVIPNGINNAGRIVGSYFDSGTVAHGFIR